MKKMVSASKYNIAWFRLAECVSRGEKERALGVYRLLSHSIDDRALQQQLEGDLFLAFNDRKTAIDHYEYAIQLYQEEQRLLEAAAVYEHLLMLDTNNAAYRNQIIDLYTTLTLYSKLAYHGIALIKQLLQERKIDDAMFIASHIEKHCNPEDAATAYQNILFSIVATPGASQETMQLYLQKSIDLLVASVDESLLQQFMSKLEVADAQWHEEAKKYLTE